MLTREVAAVKQYGQLGGFTNKVSLEPRHLEGLEGTKRLATPLELTKPPGTELTKPRHL